MEKLKAGEGYEGLDSIAEDAARLSKALSDTMSKASNAEQASLQETRHTDMKLAAAGANQEP
jgi:hypothetical protein